MRHVIKLPDFEDTGALFSADRRYRYLLWRRWSDASPLVFICLNPSTADEQTNDPTNRRCIGFAQSLGFGGMVMANLFAFKATDPKDLFKAADPVGPENDAYLRALNAEQHTLVGGWGNHGHLLERLAVVRDFRLHALKLNSSGAPAHPLYLRKDCQLQPLTIDQGSCSRAR